MVQSQNAKSVYISSLKSLFVSFIEVCNDGLHSIPLKLWHRSYLEKRKEIVLTCLAPDEDSVKVEFFKIIISTLFLEMYILQFGLNSGIFMLFNRTLHCLASWYLIPLSSMHVFDTWYPFKFSACSIFAKCIFWSSTIICRFPLMLQVKPFLRDLEPQIVQ